MRYTIQHAAAHLRYINIEVIIDDIEDGLINVQLPAWRPGRYELANFAKNVRNFKVEDEKGQTLPHNKITKDLWEILTLDSNEIKISYQYFADALNAGSTYTEDNLLYINPVNCLIYQPKTAHEACVLTLNIPDSFTIACALPKEGKTLYAKNFDELADSPIIASPTLQHNSFEYKGVTHHIWINGENTLNIETFISEVKQYTHEQVEIYQHFPTNDFHYLIHFLPYKYRHGVEHKNSTVITHGPGNEFDKKENRSDLLAICSHELFHFWNIKRLRPATMLPYNFAKENYSKLGYVYEGITTYYGDYMLLRAGVFSFDKYSTEFSKDLQKHFNNEGRYNYSVSESSFDTWLDGYIIGTPARKVSIYVEGMLAALIADIKIREATDNKNSLDTVMQLLYQRFYLNDTGYTEREYKEILEEVSGLNMQSYFDDIIHGKGAVEKQLPSTLALLGLQIQETNSDILHERLFGFKTTVVNNSVAIAYCTADSPADKAGVALNDILISINGQQVTNSVELDEVIKSSTEAVTLKTKSLFGEKEIILLPSDENYFKNYALVKVDTPTDEQKQFFNAWSKQDF